MTGGAAEPSFVLGGPTGAVLAEGVTATYTEPSAAAAALRSGRARIILGALPFDLLSPAALYTPQAVTFAVSTPDWPVGSPPPARITQTLPDAGEHRARVAEAVRRLQTSQAGLQKVVLARALRLVAEAPWDVRAILRRLADADPSAYTYLADLSPAGGAYAGATLVGASPELLLRREGQRVSSGRAVTSTARLSACAPVALTALAVSCAPWRLMSAHTTFAPSRAKISAVARPMPLAAPVMTMVLPAK